jgi:hypothetical protein
MTATNQFFFWFLYGLGGLGGWFLFFLVALIAIVWMIYDVQQRRLKATGWMMAAILSGLLIVPAILYRFTINPALPDPANPLVSYVEAIFYLGLIAGIAPLVIAVGYYVTFQGLVGCPQGHVYDAGLRQCPECARLAPPPVVNIPAPVAMPVAAGPSYPAAAPAPIKPKTQAWLVNNAGKSFQLNAGETTVGRSPQNDIQISGDTTVGRQHAKIVEQNGHFKLIDLGTKNYTHLNGQILRQPTMLEPDDEICFGDNSVLRFVSSRK